MSSQTIIIRKHSEVIVSNTIGLETLLQQGKYDSVLYGELVHVY